MNFTNQRKSKNQNLASTPEISKMKEMKACELCAGTARMYCESDEASLCFDCDAKVHGANFLVARHSRVLLCRNCQDPTPWKAAGARIVQAVSVCDRCVEGRSKKVDDDEAESRERVDEDADADDDDVEEEEEEEEEDDDDEEEEEEEDEDEGEGDEEKEEGEEQVVPWSTEPPPAATSSSSSEEEEADEEMVGPCGNESLKRMRQNADLSLSQDQQPFSSSSRLSYLPSSVRTTANDETVSDSFRPLKSRKKLDLICSNSHKLLVDFI